MKISELVRRTQVSKETIHYYLREGLLRKPRKTKKNVSEYTENHVEQIRLIKGLQDNYYLPLAVVKKILKQKKGISTAKQESMKVLSEHFRPIDRLIGAEDVKGTEAYLEATGLGKPWLEQFTVWGIITPFERNGDLFYSSNNVLIGKLLTDMDQLGFGPKDGYDPSALKRIFEFFSEFVKNGARTIMEKNLKSDAPGDTVPNGIKYAEVMGFFIYYLWHKLITEEFDGEDRI
ncbi:MAG: MerR family transcriptional regulator [Proteobacteria bacterium]|nr:MerR family transcriptional regulator [Pseudomonadota bacterium]